jgi:Spy/CpxP family protein refolding chaperone
VNSRLILAAAAFALATPVAFAQTTDTQAAPAQNSSVKREFFLRTDGNDGPREIMLATNGDAPGMMPRHGEEMSSNHHFGPMSMHHHGMEHGDFWKSPEAVKRIGLSPDQVKKLDDLSLAGKLQMIHLHAAVEEQEVMLHATMSDATLDEHKAEAEIDKAADAHAALEKADAKLKLSLRSVLTPDQWTKLHTPPEHPMGMMMHGGPGSMGMGEHHHGAPGGGMTPQSGPQTPPV